DALPISGLDPENGAKPAGAGADRVGRRDVDPGPGAFGEVAQQGSHPVLAVDDERLLRADRLPAGLPGRGLKRPGVRDEEVDLRASPAGERVKTDEVHGGVLEVREDAGALSRCVARLNVEVLDQTNGVGHRHRLLGIPGLSGPVYRGTGKTPSQGRRGDAGGLVRKR